MLSPELGDMDGARVHRRQNKIAPCPGGNGTTIGSVQQFTVLCGTSIDGDVLDRPDAFDFTTCVDLCSSFHPKCDGATFDGSRCTLRANLKASEQRRSRRFESAIATFPGASSNCASLGGSQQALGTSFTTMCGFIIDGSDISQNFAPTFQDCLGQCASTSGCAAVSFDSSQNLGFKNCYLKTAVSNPNSIGADRRTDSAMIAAAAADPPASSSPPPPPATSSSPSQSTPPVAIIPSSSSASAAPPGAGGGVIFFTPPGGGTTIVATPPASTQPAAAPSPDSSTATAAAPTQNPAPAASSSTTNPLASLFPSSPLPSTTTGGATLPFVFPSPATMPPVSSSLAIPESSGGATRQDGPSSMAWVAAPVVGGVAAIALIGVSFVMLKRRRRGSGSSTPRKETISRPSPLSGLFTAFLPASCTNSGRRMGNFSEVESGRRSAGVVGFMTGRPMGMERLEDIEEGESGGGRTGSRGATPVMGEREGRTELRKSFNGLGQNKWGQ
ncbi:hypothetical protein C8A05DRAFT_12262 [Staphylotrichum tortipilum]|uniref:Apple domain-containing protein n=1 Tax=Staphylotrichum tortipilum TaxID=2831512 RepID=A0AAN6MTZ5_9PEZI|nr:hypothetical protein C8A05DRAFT_12262 [Staphylotrichum longicolle]